MRKGRPDLEDAAAWCEGRLMGPGRPLPDRLWTDSRDVGPGDGFIALPGEHSDGHRFVGDALSNGARLVLGSEGGLAPWLDSVKVSGGSCIIVERVEESLVRMAEEYLAEVAPREKIAITGSVGKTTTRELVRSALEGSLRVHSALRSHNTLVGCSLTILGMPPDTEALLLEMGTNRPGEIAGTVAHFPPTVAVVTGIAPVHLEGLGDLEGVLAAKMEIIPKEGLKLLVFNSDDERLHKVMNEGVYPFRAAGVGFGKGSTLLLTERSESKEGDLRIGLSYGGQSWVCESSLKGGHHAHNLGFAFMVGLALQIPPEKILQGVSSVSPLGGRGRWIRGTKVDLLIDESYNANPTSVLAALDVFRKIDVPGRRWAVLGGMRELGGDSVSLHRSILEKTGFLDGLVLVGEEWEPLEESKKKRRGAAWRVGNAKEALDLVSGLVEPEDSLLVKGSRFYGLELVVKGLAGS